MVLTLLFSIILALVHVFANKISILHTLSRRKWLSLAGGVSVAFVFVHILPDLHRLQQSLSENDRNPFLGDSYLYVMAMAGTLLFYGIERALINFKKQRYSGREPDVDNSIFWSHMGVFAFFNILIGYFFHHDPEMKTAGSFLTFLALSFHFLINDYALLQHHEKTYHAVGRWIMAGAVCAGWVLGTFVKIPEIYSYALFASLAGAILVNSLKEELPEEKESDFMYFLAGGGLYTLLLIVE